MPDENVPEPLIEGPEFDENPYPTYLEWNARAAVGVDPEVGVIVAGYDNVAKGFFRNIAELSNQLDDAGNRRMGIGTNPLPPDVEEALAELHPESPALFTADPPSHTAHRKLANAAFNPRRMRALEPRIQEIADSLIEGFEYERQIEFLDAFAVPFPLFVIAGILGVKREDMTDVKRWSGDLTEGALEVLSDDRRREVVKSSRDFQTYFLARIKERREEPRDDLLSDLIHAELSDGRQLDDTELLPMILQFASAGHETTTNLLTNGLVILLRDPGLMGRLRSGPENIPAFVEEVLRYDPPLHAMFRRGKTDTEIGGCPVKKGQMVVGLIGAANWDPETFPNPERFDLDRPNARRHLSFGLGPHFCVGAELARLEVRIAFETLLRRLPSLELDEDASDLRHKPGLAIRSFRRVVVDLGDSK
jgi:cytochrome P450